MLPVMPAADRQVVRAPSERPLIDRIFDLQSHMTRMPQVVLDVEHTFGPGFYARTLHLPANTVAVGKIHATEHVFFLSKGSLKIVTEDGEQVIHAPHQLVARAGLKRAVVAITDCTCTNVHITSETDLVKLEAKLIQTEAIEAPRDAGAVQ